MPVLALGASDCEALHAGLLGQPANSLSSLAYVAAGAYVLRRGGPGIETVTDDFFDFTLGAEPADLDALDAFITSRRRHLPEHLWRADDLFVRAARIHAQLDAGAFMARIGCAGLVERAQRVLEELRVALAQVLNRNADRDQLVGRQLAAAVVTVDEGVEELECFVGAPGFIGGQRLLMEVAGPSEIAASARARNVQAVALSMLYADREEQVVATLRTLRDALPAAAENVVKPVVSAGARDTERHAPEQRAPWPTSSACWERDAR